MVTQHVFIFRKFPPAPTELDQSLGVWPSGDNDVFGQVSPDCEECTGGTLSLRATPPCDNAHVVVDTK